MQPCSLFILHKLLTVLGVAAGSMPLVPKSEDSYHQTKRITDIIEKDKITVSESLDSASVKCEEYTK